MVSCWGVLLKNGEAAPNPAGQTPQVQLAEVDKPSLAETPEGEGDVLVSAIRYVVESVNLEAV
jgi:hypothetical protein